MRHHLAFVVFLAVLAAASAPLSCHAHNITHILSGFPEFSTFNHYLTLTRLANEINRRLTITVLAVDNGAMQSILDQHFSVLTIRHILSLHVLVDYYGAKKLHQLSRTSTLSSSLFQATGAAPGTTGYVNITDHKKGQVSFAAQDAADTDSPAVFVKSVKEFPYNISVIQISSVLTSPEAQAPVPPPAPVNLTDLMISKGCASFAQLLLAADVQKVYDDNVDAGLTVFCPIDDAVKIFLPTYKNLSATRKTAVLLYHGVPVFYSEQQLKSNNGVLTTLATGGGITQRYSYKVQNSGETVTLDTRVNKATITAMIHQEDPCSIFSIDKVLEPIEVFKPSAIAPAPEPGPKKKKGAKAAPGPDGALSPDSAGDQTAADAKKDAAGSTAANLWWIAAATLATAVATTMV